MAIPKKPVVKSSPIGKVWKALQTIPLVVKEIPTLPKGKLLKLTCMFMGVSSLMYWISGPSNYFYIEKKSREAKLLNELGVRNISRANFPGTERTFRDNYGLDYMDTFKAMKSEAESDK